MILVISVLSLMVMHVIFADTNTCPTPIPAEGRVVCPGAYAHITVAECEALSPNCCFNDEYWNVPWCIDISTSAPTRTPTTSPTTTSPTTTRPTTTGPTTARPITTSPTLDPTKTPTPDPTSEPSDYPTREPTRAPSIDGCDFDIDGYLQTCYCDVSHSNLSFAFAKNNPVNEYDGYKDDEFKTAVYEFMQSQKKYNQYIMYAFFVLNFGIFIIMIYGCVSYKKLLLNNHQTIKGYAIAGQDVEDE